MKLLILLATITGGVLSASILLAADCTVNPPDLVYYFYSLQNPQVPVLVSSANTSALDQTHFSGNKETIILVHGGSDSAKGMLVTLVKNTMVNAQLDWNIIGLDWSAMQNHNPGKNIYECAPRAGDVIAEFLNVLVTKFGLKYSKLIIVGHSAAGPFCSAVGTSLKGVVKGIVGLDTSGIKKADANFVEYVHTTPGDKGSRDGHASYFPNGGNNQAGCNGTDWGCNHMRAITYYAESVISNKFVAHLCDSYADFKAGKCNSNPSGILGQLDLDTRAAGSYFLDTNDHAPYAKG